jgi:S1-C subfamily serine protease
VLTPGGEVLTNNHVIQGATSIRVVVPGSRHAYTGRVIGYDVSADVAVIQLEGASHLQTVRLGDSKTARVGASVTALGNADGAGGAPRVAPGRVVALRRSITVLEDQGLTERLQTLIETNASLQPGDSGGPLLDSDGRVIGVDTAALRVFGDQPARNQAYAIPIDRALAIARQIESGRRSSEVHVGPTPFLGIDVSVDGQAYRSGRGALIQGVAPSSPAARAGLGAGDVITSLDGLTIASAGSITHVILKAAPGMTIGIAWIGTDGTAHHGHIRLTSGPPQ